MGFVNVQRPLVPSIVAFVLDRAFCGQSLDPTLRGSSKAKCALTNLPRRFLPKP